MSPGPESLLRVVLPGRHLRVALALMFVHGDLDQHEIEKITAIKPSVLKNVIDDLVGFGLVEQGEFGLALRPESCWDPEVTRVIEG